MAKKRYIKIITLKSGEEIAQNGEYSWSNTEVTEETLNLKVLLGQTFISVEDENKVVHAVRVSDIQKFITFEEEIPEPIEEPQVEESVSWTTLNNSMEETNND